jgi:hypothetical protein
MPIRFYCPECDKPLSFASCKAGIRVPCPACSQELTVPTESTRPKRYPSKAEHPASNRQPRLSRAVLASVLIVVGVGLAAVVCMPFLGEDPPTQQTQARPGSDQVPAQAAARLDKLPNVKTDASTATEPEADSSDTDEMAEATGPAGGTSPEPASPSETPKPQPPVTQPAQAAVNPAAQVAPAPAPPPALPPGVAAQAPPPNKKPADLVRERWTSKRRSLLSDDELRQQLLLPPEVDLEAVRGATKNLISLSGKAAGTGLDLVPLLSARRVDLLGLPFRLGSLNRMNKEEALNLKVLSQQLRLQVQTSMPGMVDDIIDPRPDAETLRLRLFDSPLRSAWLRPQAIPTLRQLLMHEHRNVRLVLVEILSKIEGALASLALAERAVFDLHPDVRLAALVALKSRPVSEYEPTLIAALRYPWPAFADHAAEALIALDLRDSVAKLIPLLDARDLGEPYAVDTGAARLTVVPELVRMNHLRNCLLCHAYSASQADPIRGLVPHAEQRIPLPSSGARKISGGGRYGGGGRTTGSTGGNRSATHVLPGPALIVPTFVRPDVTYLKQDFSVDQPVANHGKFWPADQRFDYLIRLRPLNDKELIVWQDQLKAFRTAAPQRESLIFALRELTGQNPGPAVEDWKRLYSPITGQRLQTPLEPVNLVAHLKDCLLEGAPKQQAERLMTLKDKGPAAYDTALALAIPQMGGELQKLGRTILADRLYCLPLKELGQKLGDQEAEVRRAAVTVCRQRKLKALVPELIALLDDANPDVAKQTHQLLHQLAGRDLGPRRGADRDERLQAMAAWRDWWEQQQNRKAAKGYGS